MSVVTTSRQGEMLVVTSDNPPVNALGAAVRQGIMAALEEAKDETVKAVVIACAGKLVCGKLRISACAPCGPACN